MSFRIETEFAGQKVALWRRKRKRCLDSVCGPVGLMAPIRIFFWKRKRAALIEAEKLERYGYAVKVIEEKDQKHA